MVQPQAAANTCRTCGAALNPGAKFCKGCGTSTDAAHIMQQTKQQTSPASVVQQQPQQATANICRTCGAVLNPGVKFCKGCGASTAAARATVTAVATPAPAPAASPAPQQPAPQQSTPQQTAKPTQQAQQAVQTVVNKAQSARQTVTQVAGIASQLAGGTLNATAMGGETVLGSTGGGAIMGALGGVSSAIQYINPFKMLISGAVNMYKSLVTAIKNKKFCGIITALIMAAVWLLLTLLSALGINSASMRFLSWLTFAQGGLRGGIGGIAGYATGLLGGMLGKGIVAGLVTSIVMSLINKQNPLKSIGGGFGKIFPALSFKQPGSIGPALIGIGIALIGYNFMAGAASLSGTMAGIAALLMTVKALGSRAGFLRNLLGGVLAKNKGIDAPGVNTCIAGMASGFALSVPMSVIPWAYTPYAAGAVLLVAGLILFIALEGKKEVAAA